MIDLDGYSLFFRNKAKLKDTSKDCTNNEYMTFSEREVVNFDLVKRQYANDLGLSEENATSVDALMSYKGGLQLIEFKNGKVNNREIKDKARDSLLIFLDIIGKNLSYSRTNMDFFVIYNMEKNPLPHQALNDSPSLVYISECIMEKSGQEFIRFGLERYKGLYFKDVHTYSKEKFDLYLNDLCS